MVRSRLVLLGVMLGGAPVAASAQASTQVTIAVLDFTNGAIIDKAASYNPFSQGISEILVTELGRNPAVIMVDRSQLKKLIAEQDLGAAGRLDPATAAQVGKLLGAQYVVTGGFVIDRKSRLRLDARAVNVETSAVSYVETVSGDADDLLELTAQLAQQMNRGMKLPPLKEVRRTETRTPAKGRLQSLLLYSTALAEEDRNPEKARGLYADFLRTSAPDFAVEQRQRAESRLKALSGGTH